MGCGPLLASARREGRGPSHLERRPSVERAPGAVVGASVPCHRQRACAGGQRSERACQLSGAQRPRVEGAQQAEQQRVQRQFGQQRRWLQVGAETGAARRVRRQAGMCGGAAELVVVVLGHPRDKQSTPGALAAHGS
jgi:hypothetical protein